MTTANGPETTEDPAARDPLRRYEAQMRNFADLDRLAAEEAEAQAAEPPPPEPVPLRPYARRLGRQGWTVDGYDPLANLRFT